MNPGSTRLKIMSSWIVLSPLPPGSRSRWWDGRKRGYYWAIIADIAHFYNTEITIPIAVICNDRYQMMDCYIQHA